MSAGRGLASAASTRTPSQPPNPGVMRNAVRGSWVRSPSRRARFWRSSAETGRQRANSYILHLPGVDVLGRDERFARGDRIGAGSTDPGSRGDDEILHSGARGARVSPGRVTALSPPYGIRQIQPSEEISRSHRRGRGAARTLLRGNGITAPPAGPPTSGLLGWAERRRAIGATVRDGWTATLVQVVVS
jgi:hypothetical protein